MALHNMVLSYFSATIQIAFWIITVDMSDLVPTSASYFIIDPVVCIVQDGNSINLLIKKIRELSFNVHFPMFA